MASTEHSVLIQFPICPVLLVTKHSASQTARPRSGHTAYGDLTHSVNDARRPRRPVPTSMGHEALRQGGR